MNPELAHLRQQIQRSHATVLNSGLILSLLLLFYLSLTLGRAPIVLWDGLLQIWRQSPDMAGLVLQEIRMPRALLGMMIGATLGLSGAALQGLLRNPLAEPGVIGVTGSAAFGAVVAFYSGAALAVPMLLPLGGIAGALVSVLLLYALAGRESSILTLVLAGIAINALAGALTALALNLSPNPYAALEIFYWLMGSLSDRSLDHVALAILPMLAGWILLLSCRRGLDALALGEDTARSLGVNLAHVHRKIIFGVALSVGAAVAVAGGIGFVGLVVPHLVRPWVGYQAGRLLLTSALGGAVLLLSADILVRFAATTHELKLGVVTALIGAPFFLALVLKTRRELR